MTLLNKKSAFAYSILTLSVLMSEAHALAIQGLSANQNGNTTQLRINFDGRPVMPTAYQQAGSNQLMLDFNQVSSAGLPRNMPINRGVINNVTALNNGSTTRLMVGLNGQASYTTSIEGNSLLINVANGGVAQPISIPVAAPMQSAQPMATNGQMNVRVNPLLAPTVGSLASNYDGIASVNYSGNKNGGNVSITLTNESIPVDVQRQGNKLVVRTTGTTVPRHLLRQIQGSGLVANVQANNQGQNGIITINMNGDFEYQAYQAGTNLNISVVPPKSNRHPSMEDKVYRGEPLSMEFQDVSIRTVLDVLGQFTNTNIVASDNVQGNITLRLMNVPWDQALDIILKSKNLDKRQNGNVIMVAPAEALANDEIKALENLQKQEDLLPLRTEYIRLNYARAEDVMKLLDDADSPGSRDNGAGRGDTSLLASTRGVITADARTNTIIIKDTSAGIESIRAMIEKIDIPVRQVMIEARIVTATEDVSREIGVRWGGGMSNNRALSRGSTSLAVDLGNNASGGSSFSIGLLSINNFLLDLNLRAMQAENRGEVISSPKVLTADKQKARIHSGIQIPYLESSASGATTVTFKETGITLEATPNITPDGKISITLQVKNGNDTGQRVVGVPILREDNINTHVLLEDGQTVVLGGVFRNTLSNAASKVPFLGSLPGVGRLFKYDEKSNKKEELLIFITPKIVNDGISRIN